MSIGLSDVNGWVGRCILGSWVALSYVQYELWAYTVIAGAAVIVPLVQCTRFLRLITTRLVVDFKILEIERTKRI